MADVSSDETTKRRGNSDQSMPETATPGTSQASYPRNSQNVSLSAPQYPWNVLTYWMMSQYFNQQYYYQLCSYMYYWQTYLQQQGPLQAQNNAFQSNTAPQGVSATFVQGTQTVNPRQDVRPVQHINDQELQQRLVNRTFLASFAMPWVQGQQQLTTVCEATIASVPRRMFAEFIDFLFLFLTKFLVFSIFYDNMERYSQLQYTLITDEMTNLKDIEELLVQALVYRFMVFAYEVFFLMGGLHGSMGGATPGKYFMGLSVVATDNITTVAQDPHGTRVRIMPGGNLGFWRSFVRALIKNFSMTFLFPVFLTVLFFPYNRTIYDVIASSTVVVSESNRRRPQLERQYR